jgi:hypothetical protein
MNGLKNYRLAVETIIVVAVVVGLRALLWSLGVEGIGSSPLGSSIVAGGVFVMGLVVAGPFRTTATPNVRRATSPRRSTRSCATASRCTPSGASPTS